MFYLALTSHKNKIYILKLLKGCEITSTNVTAFDSETAKMECFDDKQKQFRIRATILCHPLCPTLVPHTSGVRKMNFNTLMPRTKGSGPCKSAVKLSYLNNSNKNKYL